MASGVALHQDLPLVENIGTIDDPQRVANIMIGDQHPDTAILQVEHEIADIADRDRIDPGERLVEQNEMRRGGERTRDLDTAALAAGQRDRRGPAQMPDREFGKQRIEHRFAQLGFGLGDFENGADILLDRETPENRRLLRQIADTEPRPAIHRQTGDFLAVDFDAAGVGGDQPGDDVEAGRLAGAVRAEQTDHLAALHRYADIAQHRAALEALAETAPDQAAHNRAARDGAAPDGAAIVGHQTRPLRQPIRTGIARLIRQHGTADPITDPGGDPRCAVNPGAAHHGCLRLPAGAAPGAG